MSQNVEIVSNFQQKKFALKVRRNGPQPSIFVRTFSAITRSSVNPRISKTTTRNLGMYTQKTMVCSSVKEYMAEWWLVFSQVFGKHFRGWAASGPVLLGPSGLETGCLAATPRFGKLGSWHALFIGPHRKDVGHNQNADAPCKSNPYLMRHWLSSQ